MRRKSALAGLAVAACLAVGTSALAQNAAKPDSTQTVYIPASLSLYSPAALQGPLGDVAPSLLSSETRALMGGRNPLRDLETTAAIAPGVDLNIGAGVDLTGRFDSFGRPSANDGLYLINAAAPYNAQVSGGNLVSATIALASDLHFSIGHASLSAPRSDLDVPLFSYLTQPDALHGALYGRSADATFVGADWNFAPSSGLGLMAFNSNEQNSVAASVDRSKAALSKVSNSAVAASAHVGLGDGWVTMVSYTQGVTQLDLKPTNLLGTTVDTRSYSVSVAKHGLFAENDSLGLAVNRPIADFAGRLSVAPLSNGDELGSSPLPFGAKPETDLELGYVTSFFNGALNLQANAAYQMNVEGQNGTNSLTVLSRAKINF